MELPGSSYLFTLSTLAITFAGFAALTVVMRQMAGGRLTDFDIYFIRTVLLRSFMVAGCALLPTLLDELLEITHSNIWRLSSLVATAVLGVFLATWPARRRAATNVPISKWAVVNQGAQWLTTIFLFVVATGLFFRPTAGAFSFGLTVFMFLGFVGYMTALKVFLQVEIPKRSSADKRAHS